MTARVVVVGSVNTDLVMRVPRLPKPGETLSGTAYDELPGGKGANQATVAAALGAATRFVGAVGDDDLGRRARERLLADGVDVGGVRLVPGPTGLAMITVDDAGENTIALLPGANASLTPDHVAEAFAALPSDPAVVVACFEVPMAAVQRAAREAAGRGWPLVLNPAPARPLPPDLLPLVSVLTPNDGELAESGSTAEQLLAAGVGAVLVTEGGAGSTLHRPDAPPLHIDAVRPDRVLDTVGAGDTFTAALAEALARGEDLPDAARWAAAAGSLAVEETGARGGRITADRVRQRRGRVTA